MAAWQGWLAERAAGDVAEHSVPDARLLDVHRLEATGAQLLTSHDESVRAEGLQVRAGHTWAWAWAGRTCQNRIQCPGSLIVCDL